MTVELYHGDCLEIMPTLPDGSVDMILADLPYGTTRNKWDTVIPFAPLWKEYKRVVKRNGAIVLTASQPFTSALVMSNPEWFKCEWIWLKNCGSNFANTKREPMKEHESVLVFSEGVPTFNRQMQERTESGKARVKYKTVMDTKTGAYGAFRGVVLDVRPELRVPSSVQKFNRETGLHTNQKPVALGEYLIRTYTNEGDTVLDNTMGVGSFGVAAVNTNRNFIGIEKDAGYFEIAQRRIEEAQNKAKQLALAI